MLFNSAISLNAQMNAWILLCEGYFGSKTSVTSGLAKPNLPHLVLIESSHCLMGYLGLFIFGSLNVAESTQCGNFAAAAIIVHQLTFFEKALSCFSKIMNNKDQGW